MEDRGTNIPRMGRPVALNETRLAVARVVINSPGVIVARTDEDIVEEINNTLREAKEFDKMISLRTYQTYKSMVLKKTREEILEKVPVDIQILFDEFLRVIKKKIRMEKLTILAQLSTDPKRQKRARIYERKFPKQWAAPKAGLTNGDEATSEVIEEVEVTIVNTREEAKAEA